MRVHDTDMDPAATTHEAGSVDLRPRVRRLIAARIVVSTVLLGSATLVQITAVQPARVDPLFSLIGFTYAAAIVYILLLRFLNSAPWLLDVQFAVDALIVSAFIAATGGVTSYFSTLYVLPIIAASTIRLRRGGMMVAALSGILYSGLVLAQYFAAAGWVSPLWLAGGWHALPPRTTAEYTVATNVLGFIAVAWLSGSLADSARSAGDQLERASTRIADLQALNQHVIDSLPSGLVTTDPLLRVVTFNRAAEQITGLTIDRVVGVPIEEVLQLPADVSSLMRADSIGARPKRSDYSFDNPVRGRIDIGLSAAHLQTPDGRAGFLVTFQDVTDIKKLERDARLQQRLAAVGEMAAGIAHEIRNPLASMSGSIQILRQDLPLTADQEQLMDIVLRESGRLNATITSFLAYARPQRFAIASFDVRRAVHDTALLLRNSSEVLAGHVIDVDVPSTPVEYDADEGQIKQILWNLATNGLRAMPSGGRLRLRAAFDPAAATVVVSVQDDGVGIPADEMDGLFQPFRGTFAKGTGLGLAIVHRIVSDYNGRIQVSSEHGRGTTVAVRLPVRQAVPA